MNDITIPSSALGLFTAVAGALAGVIGLLWQMLLGRLTRAECQVDKMLPLMEKLADQISRQTDALAELRAILERRP